jgi:arylsulfatase A-like enzyme
MVEEVDAWLGRLIDQLVLRGAWNNTLFIFTADHGEMLGAHGKTGKETFYEESVRVPMIFSLPNDENRGTRVSAPVCLLDLHASILDYLNAPQSLDTSDGKSLRRYIEHFSYNDEYDDAIAVAEYEYNGDPSNSRTYGYMPAFMIRKGDYKLILPRVANSPKFDMLYNIKDDRYECSFFGTKDTISTPTHNVSTLLGLRYRTFWRQRKTISALSGRQKVSKSCSLNG